MITTHVIEYLQETNGALYAIPEEGSRKALYAVNDGRGLRRAWITYAPKVGEYRIEIDDGDKANRQVYHEPTIEALATFLNARKMVIWEIREDKG